MLAQFTVLSRLQEPENSNVYSKMRVYDGQNLKDTDPKAKTMQEYRDLAGVDEGMQGLSTRFAFKILSRVFNFDPTEVAANPVHLLYVLEKQIEQEQFPQETHDRYLNYIKEFLAPRYVEFIGKEIQTAYLESYSEYGQNIFDRYVLYVAPALFGGTEARTAIDTTTAPTIADIWRGRFDTVERVGDDLRIELIPLLEPIPTEGP